VAEEVRDDNVQDPVQHGIDGDPNNDAKKGATLGGIGGAVTGAIAGSAVGPVGTVIGAAVGGVAGAVASGAAVGAVDRVDDDNTFSGISGHTTRRAENEAEEVKDEVNNALPGNKVPGIQTGGRDADGGPDTRGISEKVADAVTGDRIDDKRGVPTD
jgi:hypothetical protein